MAHTLSISRWDAVAGKDLIIFIDPGPAPVGAGWTHAGLYISQTGGKLIHLGGSDRLVQYLSGRNHIIIVEADERPYRISRIKMIRIGEKR